MKERFGKVLLWVGIPLGLVVWMLWDGFIFYEAEGLAITLIVVAAAAVLLGILLVADFDFSTPDLLPDWLGGLRSHRLPGDRISLFRSLSCPNDRDWCDYYNCWGCGTHHDNYPLPFVGWY